MSNPSQPLRFGDIMWPHEDHLHEATRAALADLDAPNVLFYGPPGTGKTSAMHVIAFEGIHAVNPTVATLRDVEKTGDLLIIDHRYGYSAPTLGGIENWGSLFSQNEAGRRFLVIDELDAYHHSLWSRIKTLLDRLRQMDVRVVAATNNIRTIDPAVQDRFQLVDMSFTGAAQRERMREWLINAIASRSLPAMTDVQLITAVNRSAGSMRSLTDEVASWEFRHRSLTVLEGGAK